MQQPPRWKSALLLWMGIYPVITTALFFLWPIIEPLPLPFKTLTLTLLVVPTMVWGMMPFLHKVFKNWLFKP